MSEETVSVGSTKDYLGDPIVAQYFPEESGTYPSPKTQPKIAAVFFVHFHFFFFFRSLTENNFFCISFCFLTNSGSLLIWKIHWTGVLFGPISAYAMPKSTFTLCFCIRKHLG